MTRKDGSKVLLWGDLTPMELRAHNSWVAMRNRCARKDEEFNDKKYYADKGVTVCDRWQNSFEAFLDDIGTPPSDKHSLDRKAGSIVYNKENCRWATDQEQAINRTSTVFITINGRTETLAEWSRISGISAGGIKKRFLKGITGEQLIAPYELPRRSNKMVTINGRTQTIAAWAREIGVTAPCLAYRLKIGMTGVALFERPLRLSELRAQGKI